METTDGAAIKEKHIDLAWRVELLRALTSGDLANVKRVVLAHIDVISAPFTTVMPSWTLQWECMHWWMLQDATPLFVASAYSQSDIVHWLLLNGADRSTACYLNQTPVQVVGECCKHAAIPDRKRDMDTIDIDSATCTRLLDEPPALPLPPTKDIIFSSTYSSEVVITRLGSMNSSPSQQTGYECLLRISWLTPLSNGAIIAQYELRYRRRTETENENQEDQQSAVDSIIARWRSERVTHTRKSRQQGALIRGLHFNTIYEFMFRSWNAAGKGEWSPVFETTTPANPTRSMGAR